MKLDSVKPWGRSLAEYRLMFALSDADMGRKILGCGDGPASFNAEMTAQDHAVVSVDPIYVFTPDEIQQRIEETYSAIISQMPEISHRFVWTHFRNIDELGRARLEAMRKFLHDFDAGQAAGRYVAESLPTLSFRDGAFQLALCSHLLLLYSEQLSYEFHLAAIWEMLRVAGEARIFPLLALDGEVSPHLDPLCVQLSDAGCRVEIQTVPYEFQKGGNQMLRIWRG
jgi:hypothetical protein